jgi:hypothetical protein
MAHPFNEWARFLATFCATKSGSLARKPCMDCPGCMAEKGRNFAGL